MNYPDELKIKMDHAAAQQRAEIFNALEKAADKKQKPMTVIEHIRSVYPNGNIWASDGIGGA